MSQKPAMRHVIARARLASGLTQIDLAKLLNCSITTVRKIEQGTLTMSEKTALKAQKLFNVSAIWLFLNDPNQPPIHPSGQPWNPSRLKQSIQENRKEAILLRLQAADQAAASASQTACST